MQEQPQVLDTPVTPETTAQLVAGLIKIMEAYKAGKLSGLVLTFVTPHEDGVAEHYAIDGMLYGQPECIQSAVAETNARFATVAGTVATATNAPRTLQ